MCCKASFHIIMSSSLLMRFMGPHDMDDVSSTPSLHFVRPKGSVERASFQERIDRVLQLGEVAPDMAPQCSLLLGIHALL